MVAAADAYGPRWEVAAMVADDEAKTAGTAIRACAITNEFVLTCSSRPNVKVWKVAEAEVLMNSRLSLEDHGAGGCSSVDVAPDGQLVAVCHDDGGIGLWDLRSHRRQSELSAQIPNALKAKFLPNGTQLVSGGPSGSLCFWDTRVMRMDFQVNAKSPTQKDEDMDGKRRRIDIKNQPGIAQAADVKKIASPVYSLAVSSDGKLLGCGRGSGAVSIMSLETHEFANDISAHWQTGGETSCVRALAFDHGSRLALSGSDDGHVCMCDASLWARGRREDRRCAQIERFSAHRGWVTSISVCPDRARRLAVTTSWDGTVKLWDYSTHKLMNTWKEHAESVFDCAFSPDKGKFFVTVGVDAQMVIYTAKHLSPPQSKDESSSLKVKEIS